MIRKLVSREADLRRAVAAAPGHADINAVHLAFTRRIGHPLDCVPAHPNE